LGAIESLGCDNRARSPAVCALSDGHRPPTAHRRADGCGGRRRAHPRGGRRGAAKRRRGAPRALGNDGRSMPVLVTGASGFVGSLLAARLASDGVAVRALAREPQRTLIALEQLVDTEDLDVVRGDPVMGEGLDRALADVDVAYYLIHSMETVPEGRAPFTERERVGAENFAAAAARAGVRRIVYLGGLLPRAGAPAGDAGTDGADRTDAPGQGASRHLASRESVERILCGAVPDSVAL